MKSDCIEFCFYCDFYEFCMRLENTGVKYITLAKKNMDCKNFKRSDLIEV